MSAEINPPFEPSYGLSFSDFYSQTGLTKIDQLFIDSLRETDAPLFAQLITARSDPSSLTDLQTSQLLLDVAPLLEDFIAGLFKITEPLSALRQTHTELAPVFLAKRKFVQRLSLRSITAQDADTFDEQEILDDLSPALGTHWTEMQFAQAAVGWLALPDTELAAETQAAMTAAKRYAAWAVHTAAGKAKHKDGILFRVASGIDPDHLVPHLKTQIGDSGNTVFKFDIKHLRRRDGFALTDSGSPLSYALDQANYCIWCHAQGRDSCSKGLKYKQREAGSGKAAFKLSAHDVPLAGCPLEERISEFQQLKAQALPIAALAMICVDNPMVAATGHRICNDCMKACIYQKQEPVNIPQVETRTLKDVLGLPWGFEIYSLLTRWNPLHLARPVPLPATGKRALVVGMGPAGFTLAHHLMNDGHTVVGIDALKIEALDTPMVQTTAGPAQAIYDIGSLTEDLDQRTLAGFGGVAEYGITVRWDKNFLRIVRLLLQRRSQFALFGGVRFGGTLTAQQAFDYGFDHIALAIGAGKPTTLDIPNGLARGVRAASDFLMALQLTGAGKKDSIANLQTRLPIVVIGGGLTAIDTSTESLAYYPIQVEKFLARFETLVAQSSEQQVRASWDTEEAIVADEFIFHAKQIRNERTTALSESRSANVIGLLQRWGGATVAYRKRLIDSPSYTMNHEEIEKAMEEGIFFAECLDPTAIAVDEYGAAKEIQFKQTKQTDQVGLNSPDVTLQARSIYVAAGTSPNTVLAREDTNYFKLDGKYFAAIDHDGSLTDIERSISKPQHVKVLTHRTADQRYVSFFGDVHPSFFGNVVKAMGSAKNGYPVITEVLAKIAPSKLTTDEDFFAGLRQGLEATIHLVRRLTPTIVEVIVKAPWAAQAFKPGQFYRLQNFETLSKKTGADAGISGVTTLQMEGLALTGAWVDAQQGLLSTIVLEMGGSADLCAQLAVGEPVILMGPTGAPTEITRNETVVLVGGGLGNAVLFSIGAALRAAGCQVLYFAGYKKLIDRYKVAEIEAAADTIVWCSDEAPGFTTTRAQDKSFVGNIVQAMVAYAGGALGAISVPMSTAQRVIAIGSDRMMAAVARARHAELKQYLGPNHHAVGSINSPMQCMMKEICAQCLQRHVDPLTGKQSVVFSCFNQDQDLDKVDWQNLNQRLRQNSVQEKLTAQWIKRSQLTQSN